MKKHLLFFACCLYSIAALVAQTTAGYSRFPQNAVNTIKKNHSDSPVKQVPAETNSKNNDQAFRTLEKIEKIKRTNWENLLHKNTGHSRTSIDTLYVGLVPNDTLVITDTFNHNGPIWVFNNGVLIFYKAVVENRGDLIVFQHGRVLSDSSSLTFPQDYFYQRSITVVQHGIGYFTNTAFNYSGYQHSLFIGDSAQVGFNNVHQRDWTTGGIFGSGTLWMSHVNLGGEFILADTGTSYYNNVDTLLLWHQLPATSVINYTFPDGDSLMAYQFNNSTPGVSGINYNVYADSCRTVWWGLMPTNGSDVTVSNSNLRTIGCWFQNGDTATVNGVYDNTMYANTVMPFSDRNFHLINSYVMTWSMYVFDSSKVNISNSAVGEVGTQKKSVLNAQNFLLDGSGGYFWATDSSVTVSSDAIVYSTARSERDALFILGYSTLPYSTPTAINRSIFISTQNNLPADPLAYDAGTMWMQNIESPGTAHADSAIDIKGSEWIDQGPDGGTLFYQNYSLDYQLYGATAWTPLVIDSAMEIRHNMLGTWNTAGLTAGTYILRLVVRDTYADSVEAFKAVNLLPGIATGINDNENTIALAVFPNPATDQLKILLSENSAKATIHITDLLGKTVMNTNMEGTEKNLDISVLAPGTYLLEVRSNDKVKRERFVKE